MTRQSAVAWKNVARILPASRPHWVGNGFNVFPVFSNLAFQQELSPWLMFDYAAPKEFPPTRERLGVGQHPHRGFETVTIAFQGEVEHSDSVGHNDVIGPGDVQWMTAGRGIIHEEYHSTAFAKRGGTFEMCQLWLNLPRKDKMVAPRYQPILDKDIPVVPLAPMNLSPSPPPPPAVAEAADGDEKAACDAPPVGSVRVIAGELDGHRGPAATFSPVELWDVHLPTPSAPVLLKVPDGHNTIVFVRSGELEVGPEGEERRVGPQSVALMERDGEALRLVARAPDTRVLLLGGEPLDEPIAARGPFVMSTDAELRQANEDFMSGRMGGAMLHGAGRQAMMVTLLVARVGGWSAHRAAGVAARHVLRGSGSTASQVGYPAAIGRPIESVRRSYACAALAEKEASGEKKQKQKQKQQQKKGGGGGGNKGLTSRETDFSQWYQEVIAAADLVDQSPVKGCMVIKPYGMGLWESIREDLDRRIKKSGAQNAYFPLFIPVEFLSKEAEHVEGFAKECAVVTHHRLRSKEEGAGVEPDPEAELEEPLIVRPTSETMIWHMFQRWIMSYRDLPLKINQWANVVRWELRTRPFLRSAEFLWQEGHTAHATAEEADASAREMLDAYADLCADLLAMPVVKGMKSPTERFAGADETYTIEALMQNGWALQSGTSHFLGQNFAKAFDVYFTTKDNKNELVWATSYGASTRLIGGLVMTHSDDQGLVLPPNVAPTQVVLVPISPKGPEKAPEQHAELMEFVDDAVARLEAEGLRVKVDERWNMKPGPKFFEWEKKGVPLRIECGPRDVEARSLLCARRTGGDKFALTLDDSFGTTVAAELAAMQSQLLEAATERMKAATFEPATYEEMASALEGSDGSSAPGFFLVPWHDDADAEEKVKKETKATIRCFPLDEQHRAEGQSCFMTGRPATHMALFARAF